MIGVIQVITALIVGMCYYMLAVAMTVYDGLLSMILQPIIGAVLSGITISLLLIIGLPIRLNRNLNRWWRTRWWIPFVIGTAAFVMMCLSWHPHFRVTVLDPELQQMVNSFNPSLAIGGWMLTLFAVLHFYPPMNGFRSRFRMD